MQIIFYSLFWPTPENYKGPSALPYYLLKYRPENISVMIYSYNTNRVNPTSIKKISEDLGVGYTLLKKPFWIQMVSKYQVLRRISYIIFPRPLDTYIYPSKNTIEGVKHYHPTFIWYYPNTFYKMMKNLSEFKQVVTGPDAMSLTYFRSIQDPCRFLPKSMFWGNAKILSSFINMDGKGVSKNIVFHVVGMDDYRLIKEIQPKKEVFFILHPHYQIKQNTSIDLHKGVLNVIIPGSFNFYTETATKQLVPVLCAMSEYLKAHFSFTFLGKGWGKVNSTLSASGVNCRHILWVDNYVQSISEYDIQLSPISVGAGTKGKVLDALANGLLTIGTPYALENITVRNMDSCILYKSAYQIPAILSSILSHPDRYERIAQKGMFQVRKYHDPQRISYRFFRIIQQYWKL